MTTLSEYIFKLLSECELGTIPAHNPSLGECWINTKRGRTNNGKGYLAAVDPTRLNDKGLPVATNAHRIIGKYLGFPSDKYVTHKCNNKICVNPYHLSPGTPKQNTLDIFKHTGKMPRAKFTEQQVRDIRKAPSGTKGVDIAEKYGVTCSTIGYIWKGAHYQHIPLKDGEWLGSRKLTKKGVVNDQKQQDTIIQNSSSPV